MAIKQKNPMVQRRQRSALLRVVIQIVFFLLAPSAFSSAFAGIKEIGTEFSAGAVLEWTSFTTILVFLLAFTVVFGRFFCGYACAFGAVGDWIHLLSAWIQKKLFHKVFALPKKSILILQWLKYIVLAGIFILCVLGKQAVINENSPWTVFSFLSAGNAVPTGKAIGIVLLLLIVCGMAVQERFFCQFLCPMGAIFSLIPVLPLGQLKRERGQCLNGCSACVRLCPVNLELEENALRSGECIRCGKCSGICPKQNIRTGWFGLRGNEFIWTVLQAAAMFAGLLIL
jgi:polyferredoxin